MRGQSAKEEPIFTLASLELQADGVGDKAGRSLPYGAIWLGIGVLNIQVELK